MARKPADQAVHPDDIIRAAADAMRENGYDATTMKDIAARVNLTAASLYHHFKNKDYLLLATLELGLQQVIDRLEPIIGSDNAAPAKLRQMIIAHVEAVTANPTVGAAMVFEIRSLMSAHVDDPEFIERREAFFKQRDRFEQMFHTVIEEGVAQEKLRPVNASIVTKSMLGAHNWVGVWYKESGRLSGESIAQIMADIFVTSLTIDPSSI